MHLCTPASLMSQSHFLLISLCHFGQISGVAQSSVFFSDAPALRFPPIRAVSYVQNGSLLSGYDYPCHTNLEDICVHISTLARTDAHSPAWDAKVDTLAGTCTQLKVSMMLLHFAHAQIFALLFLVLL